MATAVAHLSTAAGLARWNLGLWNTREAEPGLLTGESLFDGSTAWVRVHVDADPQRTLIDYAVGAFPQQLVVRIRASVMPAEPLGYGSGSASSGSTSGSCIVTLTAWRVAGVDDGRWQRLTATHETELDLIQAQLATGGR